MADQKDESSVAEFWEYVIAGIVILFFGALYWMLTRDIPEDEPLAGMAAQAVSVADEQPSRVAQVYAERAKLADAEKALDAARESRVADAAPVQAAVTAAPVTGAVLDTQVNDAVDAEAPVPAPAEAGMSAESTGNGNAVAPEVTLTHDAEGEPVQEPDAREAGLSESVQVTNQAVSPVTHQATNDLEVAITRADEKTSFVFDALYFDTGSENIKPASRPQIKYVASVLSRYPDVRVLIRGHTDNTGTVEGNTRLALDRSVSVGLALVALGVTKDRIEVESVGANEPVASNDTEAGRQQNRRIELKIIE